MNLLIATTLIIWVSAANTQDAPTNKTKRTITGGPVQNYGENRPVLLYPENSSPQTLASLYSPVTIKPVFEPEVPKQVAAQQVLYEFQQTPTNAVSNVHVNQYYQPVPKEGAGPAPYISGSESVATPVQHSSLIRHGQNYAQVQIQPLPQHIQTHQYVPGKYLYVNGKIIYPQQAQTGPQTFQPQQSVLPQRPNYLYTHPQSGTMKFVPPPLVLRPAGFRRFNPPAQSQFQPITKPMGVNTPPVTEAPTVEEEEEEEKEEEEVDDAEESYEDDDDDRYFSKYSFDEEDDHESDAEEDEDNERGSSKTVTKKHKKKPTKPEKYTKGDNYKYKESYTSSSKYEKPKKKVGKVARNPKSGSGKSRSEKLEGKQSRNVPVVHKQKIFKEKWYVTKSMDD